MDEDEKRYTLARTEDGKSRFEELLEQNGAMPEGEAPRTASDHRKPRQTDPYNRVNRFARCLSKQTAKILLWCCRSLLGALLFYAEVMVVI